MEKEDADRGRAHMLSEIARPNGARMFESLALDVSALTGKYSLEMIDEEAYLLGLETLLSRLRTTYGVMLDQREPHDPGHGTDDTGDQHTIVP